MLMVDPSMRAAVAFFFGGRMGARILHHPFLIGREESISGEERVFEGGRIMLCSLYWWRWDCMWFGAGAVFEVRENWVMMEVGT